jgi:monoamine oxidase
MVMISLDFKTEDWSTIKHGMSRLPWAMAYLLGYRTITYGARVTGVRYAANGGVDIVATGINGSITVNFDKVILAIPPAALKMIADRPRWSVPKELAIRSMYFYPVFKMGLRFKTRFWERIPAKTAGGQSTTDLPIHWIVYPSNGIGTDGPGVLIAYSWMTDASTWLPLTPTERRSLALFCLAEVYNDEVDPQTNKKINVYDLLIGTADAVWSESTATGCALFLPGQFKARFEPARKPEGPSGGSKTIFFAGEQLSRIHSWIAGALESGHHAVCQMIGYVPPLRPWIHPIADWHPGGLSYIDPTHEGRLDDAELEHGVPIILGSRGEESIPTVDYDFNPREPLFKFGNAGWTARKSNSADEFPLHLGVDPDHPLGVDLTDLTGPAC